MKNNPILLVFVVVFAGCQAERALDPVEKGSRADANIDGSRDTGLPDQESADSGPADVAAGDRISIYDAWTDDLALNDDAGTGVADAGDDDAGSGDDAGTVVDDAGTVVDDAGTVVDDAGTVVDDAGTVGDDAGTVAPDAGDRDGATAASDATPIYDTTGGGADAATPDTAAPDAGPLPNQMTIAELRAHATGPVEATLRDVYVTYKRDIGFFVQAQPLGPGLYVHTLNTALENIPVEVGNKVTLYTTELFEYNSQLQLRGDTTAMVNSGGSYDVMENLAQDISAAGGTIPNATLEDELVLANDVTVVGGDDNNLLVTYGSTPVTAALYLHDGPGLCWGTTFDLGPALVRLYQETYQIQVFSRNDLTNIESHCESNWHFEDWDNHNLIGFTYPDEDFLLEQVAHDSQGGSYAARVTWTTRTDRLLVATAKLPVAAGDLIACEFWAFDNDDSGGAKLWYRWHLSDGSIQTEQSSGRTGNQDVWQKLRENALAPDNATHLQCGVKFYDNVQAWDGDASISVDDMRLVKVK